MNNRERDIERLPRTKAFAVFAFVNELLVNEVERNIYETSVSIPWFIQLLLLFLLIYRIKTKFSISKNPEKSQKVEKSTKQNNNEDFVFN